jgi:hypothetical protein
MGIHLFRYVHGGERMNLPDVVWDAFVAIAKDTRFHVSQKPTTLNPCPFTPALQSSHYQVNIVLSVDGVHTLVEVVIIDITRVDCFWGVVTIITALAKDGFYHDRFPMDMFLRLMVEVFKCLH